MSGLRGWLMVKLLTAATTAAAIQILTPSYVDWILDFFGVALVWLAVKLARTANPKT